MNIKSLFFSCGVFIIISSSSSVIREQRGLSYFVVWNIGQGQWTTFIHPELCHHVDVGGEFAPLKKIRFWCASQKNEISLSHWDLDHVGLIPRLKGQNLCLRLRPLGKASAKKESLLRPLQNCTEKSAQNISKFSPVLSGKKSENAKSHVQAIENILLPGDSTTKEESVWIHQIKGIGQIRLLVLGHHGSASSTSDELLAAMPHLKMAVASARWNRYRHPHPKTLATLSRRKIPILRTEDWGNLFFEINPMSKWPRAF